MEISGKADWQDGGGNAAEFQGTAHNCRGFVEAVRYILQSRPACESPNRCARIGAAMERGSCRTQFPVCRATLDCTSKKRVREQACCDGHDRRFERLHPASEKSEGWKRRYQSRAGCSSPDIHFGIQEHASKN